MHPDAPERELVIEPEDGAVQYRARLLRPLLTLGSDAAADVRLPGLPARWALVRCEPDGVQVRLLGRAEVRTVQPGAPVVCDGVRLSLATGDDDVPAAVEPLVARLSDAESPTDALRGMLDGLLRLTGAESGAVLLREGHEHRVAVASQRVGPEPLPAELLLSDSIVRDVLAGGERVLLEDARHHDRYGSVPSVAGLRLRSVLCVPMRLGELVLGAVFLGTRDLRRPLTRRHAADVGLVASMAVPLLVQLRRHRPGAAPADAILVGESPAIRAVRDLVGRVGPSSLSVLVHGETGSGKELVARALHATSPRAARPLVAINCSAVAESLLQSELFGHRRGAYTGAVSDRKGAIEQADGGTLFLDEVGDMPLAMQAALLRVLEQRAVVRLGENEPRPVDFRLVSATHKDLEAEVRAGRFREDLLFRLRELTIVLPPLARRREDILLLGALFLRQAEQELGLPGRRIGPAAAEALLAHPWPGNVRELRATMRRAAVLAEGPELRPAHLALAPTAAGPAPPAAATAGTPAGAPTDLGDLGRPLDEARDDFVRRYVSAVLAREGGDREAAAAALGISVRSLYRYLA